MTPKLLTTIQSYSLQDLIADVVAGITVALVALPLSIAIAIASGADPAKGLVTAIIAGYMAMPALAALLILTAWNMSEPHKWATYVSARPSDRFLLLLTLVLTVLADLIIAIGVGVAIGLALRLRRRDVPPSDWSVPDR